MRRRFLAHAAALMSMPRLGLAAPADAEKFIEQSFAGLQDLQLANDSLWRMSEATRFQVEMRSGEISFHFANGKSVVAPLQIVGSLNPSNGTFLWAWDHPNVPAHLARAARATRAWAAPHQLEQWTNRVVSVTEEEAWRFTAVAARLDNATGAYRAPTGGPIVFMVFVPVTIRQSGKP